jgi:phosphoenolpyruvate carboxylase
MARIKFTEQGEVLSYKYSNHETAVYELTLGVTGLLKASRIWCRPHRAAQGDYQGIMDQLARYARRLPRPHRPHPGFWTTSTRPRRSGDRPAEHRLAPSHRKKGTAPRPRPRHPLGVRLGAVRHTLPAWYGIGTALEPGGAATRRGWPSCSDVPGMALLPRPAVQHPDGAVQGGDEDRHGTGEKVAQIEGLLEENPVLAVSLQRRDPYLDPLNHIQFTLLKRVRARTWTRKAASTGWIPLLRSINASPAGCAIRAEASGGLHWESGRPVPLMRLPGHPGRPGWA